MFVYVFGGGQEDVHGEILRAALLSFGGWSVVEEGQLNSLVVLMDG